MAEILHGKGLGVDLVHGAGGIGNGSDFIGIVFLPPVQGRRDIDGNKNLADKFAVIASGLPKPHRQIQIVGPQYEISIFIIIAVYPVPAV